MDLFDKCQKLDRSLYNGDSRMEKVGKTNVLVSRDNHLDRNGNPVYRAKVLNSDGSFGKEYRTNNSYAGALYYALSNHKKYKK